MAADVKTRLLMAVGQQARALNRTTVSWDEMRAAFTWEDICKWQLPKFGQTTAKEALGTAAEIISDSASASSASDSTSDSEQSIDGDGLEWFRQSNGGKYHLLQAMCASAWFLGADQCLLTLLILIGETASRTVTTGAESVYSGAQSALATA